MTKRPDDQARPDTEAPPAIELWPLIELSPDGIVLADELGTIVLVNAQIESMFGYERTDLLGQRVECLLPDRQRQIHRAHRTRYRVEPTPRSMGAGLDLWARRKDGTEFPVEVSLSPVPSEQGMRVVATVRDMTERRAAEAESHTVLHTLDATRDGVFMFTPDTLKFTYVNQGAIRQLGYTEAELLEMSPLHIKPDFTEVRFREMLAPLIADDVALFEFTTIHRRKDGIDIPVEIVLENPPAMPGASGPRRLVAVVREISERLETERVARQSQEAFRTAFEAAPVGMALVDFADPVQRRIVNANASLCQLLGYSETELLTKGFADLTHPDDAKEGDDAALEAVAGDRSAYALEKRYIHAEGHDVWVWVHSAVLDDGETKPTRVLVQVVDLTDRRQAERERERSRSWLQALADIRAEVINDAAEADVLQLVCRHAVRLVEASGAAIYELTNQELRRCSVDNDATARMALEQGLIGPRQRSAPTRPRRLTDPLDVAEWLSATTTDSTSQATRPAAVLVLPIDSPAETDRLLVVFGSELDQFFADDLATLEGFADQAATAMRLHQAQKDQARLRLLEDRERLAEELHDLVIQRLFAAGMGLQSLQSGVEGERVKAKLNDAVDQIDLSIAELRTAIFKLSTPQPLGLRAEIEQIIATMTPTLGFTPRLEIRGDLEDVPGVVIEQLLPVINEALSNVGRHAHATEVDVVLRVGPEVALSIIDNGRGLDPDAATGHGLNNIRSRAERLHGASHLVNNSNQEGATLSWNVPI